MGCFVLFEHTLWDLKQPFAKSLTRVYYEFEHTLWDLKPHLLQYLHHPLRSLNIPYGI